jgi:CBS domain-containing protein
MAWTITSSVARQIAIAAAAGLRKSRILPQISRFSLAVGRCLRHDDQRPPHLSLVRSLSMASVRDLLAGKGRRLITVSPRATVFAAAVIMNEHKIGSLLVMDEGQLVGILTERDILLRVVADQRDANHTDVGEVMTRDVVCCRPHTDLEEAKSVFKHRRIRHLPVLTEEGEVVGLISIGDLNAYQVDEQERTIFQLQEYIHGTW